MKVIFSLKDKENKSLEFYIKAPEKGSGQNVYGLKVRCSNIESSSCITKSPIRMQKSSIFANYIPTSEETILKQSLKKELLVLFDKTMNLNLEARKINALLSISNNRMLYAHIINYSDFNNRLDYLNNLTKRMEMFWDDENYLKLNESFGQISGSFVEDLEDSIKKDSLSLSSQIADYNRIISSLEIVKSMNKTINQSEIDDFNEYIKSAHSVRDFNEKIWPLTAKASIVLASLIEQGNILLKSESEFLCLERGFCKEINLRNANSNLLQEINALKDICSELNFENASNYSIKKNIDETEKKDIILKSIKEYADSINSFIDTGYKINPTLDFKCRFLTENFNNISFGRAYLLQEIIGNCLSQKGELLNNSLSHLLILGEVNSSEFKGKYCSNYINPANLSYYKIAELTNITADFTLSLEETPPLCCIFGKCGLCCLNCTKTYPIIFLHGHLFNKQNSPESSLDIFSKMQERLENEGYVNAGIILPSLEKVTYGEWGLHGNPISVRATYYYTILNDSKKLISFKYNDDIATYAERLDNIIEMVKERTGRDKVIIIAHSMGGLVARAYISEYSNNSINKLIMIATPNNGISSTAKDLCLAFGEQQECNDMSSGSQFMSSIENQPLNNMAVYLINGRGCDTDGEDGDGVVKYRETMLYGSNLKSYDINGKCSSLSSLLHEEIIDIDKYPEVYSDILSILEES